MKIYTMELTLNGRSITVGASLNKDKVFAEMEECQDMAKISGYPDVKYRMTEYDINENFTDFLATE